MKNRILMKVMCVMFSMVLAAGSMAYAESGGGKHGKGHDGPNGGKEILMDSVLYQLDLTSGQKDQIRQQRGEHKSGIKKLRAEMKEQKEELKDLIHAKQTDMVKINQVISEMSKTNEKMTRARVDGILGLKGVLTPEQLEKFQELMKEHKEKRKKMRENRKGAKGERGPKEE